MRVSRFASSARVGVVWLSVWAAACSHDPSHAQRDAGPSEADAGVAAVPADFMPDAGAEADARPNETDAELSPDAATANTPVDERDAAMLPSDASPDAGATEFLVASVSAGYAHACAIDFAGHLYCWGQNGFGQLGHADRSDIARPGRVGDRDGWSTVSAGRFHSCGIQHGELYCWGNNAFGQAGQAMVVELTAPARVSPDIGDWSAVSAGDWHTCALRRDGRLYCWGYEHLGRLGNGRGGGGVDDPGLTVTSPLQIGDTLYREIDASAAHTCALGQDGSLYCWGAGDQGQLGMLAQDSCDLNGTSSGCELTPRRVRDTAAAVSTGVRHTCILTESHSVSCFGANDSGQLGTPELSEGSTLGENSVAVRAGGWLTCTIANDRKAACFGTPDNDASSLAGFAWQNLDVAAFCVCGVTQSHSLYCWGTCPYASESAPASIVTPD